MRVFRPVACGGRVNGRHAPPGGNVLSPAAPPGLSGTPLRLPGHFPAFPGHGDPCASLPILPGGRGSLNVFYGANDIGGRLVRIGPDSAKLNAFGDGDSGMGFIDCRDPESFSGWLSGRFVFACNGVTSAGNFPGAAGTFAADGSVSITNGIRGTIDGGAAGRVQRGGTHVRDFLRCPSPSRGPPC